MNTTPLPKKEWHLTQESFARFLFWLDPDPDEAGKKYETIRRKLIRIFVCRGCICPEDLSDETINRVIRKAQDFAESYEGDPALFFYGVANHVHLEYLRKRPIPPQPLQNKESGRVEVEYECLEKCIEQLLPRSRELVIQYYQEDKQAKINYRKALASRLGIPLNALRIRAFRIRMSLYQCVLQCLGEKAAQ
jgi:DNA-directed RNA polymerase specialized sigma24 family protein